MATRMTGERKLSLSWRELSELLSKARILSPVEDLTNLTLVKPRTLLIFAGIPVKEEPKEKPKRKKP